MANLKLVKAIDLKKKKAELEELITLTADMTALKGLIKDETRELVLIHSGRSWNYDDLLGLAHRYLILGRKHSVDVSKMEVWLNSEKNRLAKLGLEL